MENSFRIFAAAALCGVAALSLGAQQSGEGTVPGEAETGGEVHLAIAEGAAFVRVAVPPPLLEEKTPELEALARELREVILNDLTFAWNIELLSPSLYKYVPEFSLENRQLKIWRSLGADAVFIVVAEKRGGGMKAEGRLFDARTGQMIFGKRLRGELELKRSMGHAFSDEIVYYYTGTRGSFGAPLVFATSRGGEGRTLATSDYDGESRRLILSASALNMLPAWSPDSEHILFTSFEKKPVQAGLFLIDRFGLTEPKKLTRLPMATGGAFSPDGRRIVFSASDGDGNLDLYVCRRDGKRLQRLTHHPAIDTAPAWSPTGREIAFTSDRGGSPQIYAMDAEGANVRRLSRWASYCDAPAWSPDGGRIVYTARLEGSFHLVVLDLATGEEVRLTEPGASHESPSWSPDGSMLAYASNRTGRYQIYVSRSDGTRARQVTSEGENTTPSWAAAP
ncbi:MAG: PD40 domain-containing protein [Acidobacteriota bacterium]|nr:MAG: PD40 domain-containing protein [Acidobacteriota bacterium]